MDLNLKDRVVVITGANSGIGLAAAQAFAAEGARVVGGDLEVDALGRVGDSVQGVTVDLTTPAGPATLAQAALDTHGRIDVLVNNVGAARHRTSFLEVDDDAWRSTLDLNFMAMCRTARAVLPSMLDNGRGSIVSVASDAGRQPDPFYVDYCVSKAAVLSLAKSLSIEFGPRGIRSNAISPGPTRTPGLVEFFEKSAAPDWGMTTEEAIDHFAKNIRKLPLGHLGQPEDVANVMLFLASDASQQVTGSEYRVDGGVVGYT